MGLMLRRLALMALLCLALYATFFRRETPPDESVTDARFQELNRLATGRRQAMIRWSALAARDTALGYLAKMEPRQRGPRLIVTGFPADVTSPAAESIVLERWKAVGTSASSTRIVVMLYNRARYDSVQTQTYPYSGALLLRSLPEAVCVAMTHGSLDTRKQQIAIVKSELDRALAPCLLQAAFGAPGNGMRSWLEATRYAAAQSNAWLSRSRSFVDGGRQTPWAWMYGDGWDGVFDRSRSSVLMELAGPATAMALMPPYQMGGPALRCLNGNDMACSRSVLEPVLIIDNLPSDLTYSWGFGRGIERTILAPHPIGEWFLSDLIRDQGRERFAKFWKSSQPIDAAFREAYGRDLGSWTREWGLRQWERSWYARESGNQLILGATLAPSWPLLVLGWTAVAVLIAAWTAKRRQVT